jgi:hypothetical protein
LRGSKNLSAVSPNGVALHRQLNDPSCICRDSSKQKTQLVDAEDERLVVPSNAKETRIRWTIGEFLRNLHKTIFQDAQKFLHEGRSANLYLLVFHAGDDGP